MLRVVRWCRAAGPRHCGFRSQVALCRDAAAPGRVGHAVVPPYAVGQREPALSCGVAACQDHLHQGLQRAGEVVLAYQESAVAGVDDVNGPARRRLVRRRAGQDLLDEDFPAVSVGQLPGVEHPAADGSVPPDLGDRHPHVNQCAPSGAATLRLPGIGYLQSIDF
jgi:hypothetical protein